MANELIKVGSKDIMAYLRGDHESVEVPRPYENVTLLVNTYLSRFAGGLTERARKAEENEEKLTLRCVQGDAERRDIVAVSFSDGTELGYVPPSDTPMVFRLLSAGKMLYATISAIESRGGHPKVKLAVFMQD